jgi:hypothetical protein
MPPKSKSKARPKKAASKKKASKKKSAAKKHSARSNAKKAVSKATSRARKAASKATSRGRSEGSRFAVSVLDLQKTSFDNAVKAIESMQKQTEKVLKELIDNSSFMPGEGKKIIEEWRRLLKRSQGDFTKTVDKSFDLWTSFFERVRREEAEKAKEAKAKAAPKKTKVKVKRKPKKAAAKKKKSATKKRASATGSAS